MQPILNMLCEDYSREKVGSFYVYYDLKPKKYYGRQIPEKLWTATSNYNEKDVGLSFDRNVDTLWGTIEHKREGMFYELDLGKTYDIFKIALFNYNHWQNYPIDMVLKVSQDGINWKRIYIPSRSDTLFWSGPRLYRHLEDGRMELIFEPVKCRYIKIIQNGFLVRDPWEINEIFVWEYTGDRLIEKSESNEIYNFLSNENITNVYADFWMSAMIDQLSDGRIKTLKAYNKQYPDKEDTSKFIDLTKDTAFIIDNENVNGFIEIISPLNLDFKTQEFKNYTCFYTKKDFCINEMLFWDGYGLLKTNRLFAPLSKNITTIKKETIFKGGIKFLGYSANYSNGKLYMDYFWQVKKIPLDTFVYVHFVKNGKVVFQNDHPLLVQFSLPEGSENNEIFRESYILDNIPPGTYDIVMGLWLPEDKKRIPIKYPNKGESKVKLRNICIF